MAKKTKSLKYLEYLSNIRLLSRIRTFHHQILEVKESDLGVAIDRNPYQIFRDWVTDTFYIGILCTLTLTSVFGWFGIVRSMLLIAGMGVLPTLIREFRKSFKGEK